ncbi:MAG: tetratricopeptide repeat protein [Planctomycetaceae bacterium]|nr:tetratricopeptide repeat protein [Planctomycetaceae bacterium]
MTENEEQQHYHHSPETTELEKFLSRGLEKIEPFTSQILIGCLVLTVAAVGGILFYRNAEATQQASWQRYVECRAAEDFEALAKDYPETTVGHWAQLQAGRLFLEEGLNQALTDRSTSDDRLGEAQKAFQTLLDAKPIPEIEEEALYGQATTLEALSDGKNLDKAVDYYQQLLDTYPESQHAAWAKDRLESLAKPEAVAFYKWFRTTNPKPADRPMPQDFPSTSEIPSLPDLNLPSEESAEKTEEMSTTVSPDEQAPAFPENPEKKSDSQPTGDRPPAPETSESTTDAADAKEVPVEEKAETSPEEKANPPAEEPETSDSKTESTKTDDPADS